MNTCVNTVPVDQPASNYTWPSRNGAAIVVTGVLKISGMPRALRPEDDPLTAQWCTRWYRDEISMEALVRGEATGPGMDSGVGIGCHQVLTGTEAELAALESAVCYLAQRYGFSATVRFS